MQNLMDDIETAFDLSHLSNSEFPQTKFQSVGILGGGTAGYFTALALKKCHPNLNVTIIESSKIPVIGVGESTTTEIVPFLHHLLGFDPLEFFAEVKPTLKFGIQFDWGKAGDNKFNFNFFASHHHESYFYEKSIDNSNWPSVLMNSKKVPVVTTPEGLTSLLNAVPFSYHLDNKTLVKYLNKKILEEDIPIIDAEVNSVNLDKSDFVTSLNTTDKQKLSYDFYIDCSGFRSKILGEALKTEYISFEKTLITDKALIFSAPNNETIDPYTSALTMNSGWCWKIPMRDENHYGYVFSSKFCSEKEALSELVDKFGDIKSHKIISFKSGRHKLAWNKNVYAIGNAYAFIEPLESTAIQTVIHSIMLLCRLMPNSLEDKSSITGLNKEIAANWDTFRWFLGIHYKFNQKLNTPFWSWCRENTDIGDANEVVQLFSERAPLSKGHYGTNTGYTAHEALVFNAYSYDTLLFGQDLVPASLAKPNMSKEEYDQKCKAYHKLTDLSLDQRQLFSLGNFSSQILTGLFQDPESWIVDTPV